jgi:hypothetical protein
MSQQNPLKTHPAPHKTSRRSAHSAPSLHPPALLNLQSLTSDLRISNRQPGRLETASSHRKQRTATISNSQLCATFEFDPSPLVPEPPALNSFVPSIYFAPRLQNLIDCPEIRNVSNPFKTNQIDFSNRSNSRGPIHHLSLSPSSFNSFVSSPSSDPFAPRLSLPFGVCYSPCNHSTRQGAA